MRVEWILVLVALIAGTAVPAQFAVNAQLRGVVGGPITAATISFFVGTIALLVAVLVVREGTPALAGLSGGRCGGRRLGTFSGRSTWPPPSS